MTKKTKTDGIPPLAALMLLQICDAHTSRSPVTHRVFDRHRRVDGDMYSVACNGHEAVCIVTRNEGAARTAAEKASNLRERADRLRNDQKGIGHAIQDALQNADPDKDRIRRMEAEQDAIGREIEGIEAEAEGYDRIAESRTVEEYRTPVSRLQGEPIQL